MVSGVILDFNRTLYDPDLKSLVNGAMQLLERLRSSGYALCLISKKSTEERMEQIASLGIDKYFKKILVIEGSKTEEHFRECMDAMALPAKDIAVVGDRIREEISLGNRMGMHTIWYKAGKFAVELPEGKGQEPYGTVTSLGEVWDCLQAMK